MWCWWGFGKQSVGICHVRGFPWLFTVANQYPAFVPQYFGTVILMQQCKWDVFIFPILPLSWALPILPLILMLPLLSHRLQNCRTNHGAHFNPMNKYLNKVPVFQDVIAMLLSGFLIRYSSCSISYKGGGQVINQYKDFLPISEIPQSSFQCCSAKDLDYSVFAGKLHFCALVTGAPAIGRSIFPLGN